MSWLARSIANSLNLNDDDDEPQNDNHPPNPTQNDAVFSPDSPRGVKEDISELTKTLTRQFWGVASFLAPPPANEPQPSDQAGGESPPSDLPKGIRSDFAEIGGRLRSGIEKISSNLPVSEITKMATSLLQFRDDEDVVGLTEDVLAFVRDVSMHPETWLDFPLPDDESDDEFELSDAQQEHALAVEHLVPRLAALRIELCPGYMSESTFWKIYFVLLHPRLDSKDAELLSTPEIVKARSLLSLDLQNRSKPEQEQSRTGASYSKSVTDSPHEEFLSVLSKAESESVILETTPSNSTSTLFADPEEKHPLPSVDVQVVDKSVIEGETASQSKDKNVDSVSTSNIVVEDEDDGDDWLKEESSETVPVRGTTIPIENEEDVSFSDLEDDDDGDVPTSYKKVTYSSDSSTKDSRDWVQLGRSSADSAKDIYSVSVEHAGSRQVSTHNSEAKESNDWLDIDDIDVA